MKIILFGSGQGGQMATKWLPADWELLAFADNSPKKQGTYLNGIPVISPARIPDFAPDLVWITILNRDAAPAIRKQLKKAGYAGAVETLNPFRNMMDLRLAHVRLFAEEIQAIGLPGAIAELGVYKGALAAELNRLFPERKLYLFDTFTGFSETDIEKEKDWVPHTGAAAGNFHDTSIELVKSRLPYPENVFFCKGHFPETLPEDLPPLAFVSLDPDLYEPTLAGLCAFWPKLVPGGAILVHDYNSFQYEGVKKAVRLFCKEEKLSPLPLADLHGSAVLMKQR